MNDQTVKETITVEREKLILIENLLFSPENARESRALSTIKEILNPTPTMTTMTTEDWQRVLDEGFYVRTFGDYPKIKLLPPICATLDGEEVSETYEVAREKGLRQPHFQGHSHPEGKVLVEVYYDDNTQDRMYADDVVWNCVTEYIELCRN